MGRDLEKTGPSLTWRKVVYCWRKEIELCWLDKVDKELTNVTSTKVSLGVNSHKVWCNAAFGQETAPELTGMLPETEVCFHLSQQTLPYALKQLTSLIWAPVLVDDHNISFFLLKCFIKSWIWWKYFALLVLWCHLDARIQLHCFDIEKISLSLCHFQPP